MAEIKPCSPPLKRRETARLSGLCQSLRTCKLTYLQSKSRCPVCFPGPFLGGIHPVQIGKPFEGDLYGFVLSVRNREGFACHEVVVNRDNRAAAASEQIAQCDDAGRLAVPVQDICAIIVIDDLGMAVLQVSSDGRIAASDIFAVLRAADPDVVAILQILRCLRV